MAKSKPLKQKPGPLEQKPKTPEQKDTWEQFQEELKLVNNVLNSLDHAQPTEAVNKKLLQQVKILAKMVGSLNAKVKLK